MNKQEFIQNIKNTFSTGINLVEIKNRDYANDQDPFKNFKFASLIGISVEEAILVRVSDKIARISNLLKKEADVKDETIEDTIIDCINYLAILKAYINDSKK